MVVGGDLIVNSDEYDGENKNNGEYDGENNDGDGMATIMMMIMMNERFQVILKS